uniref:Uncharacterized protein n=1 Tax=Plectus sambesii TaxID=2011161 RepID=A0A914XTR5_9BILA
MKEARVVRPFSGKQKKYLDDASKLGVKKKSDKVDAKQLAKQMDEEIDPKTSQHLFDFNELLTATQIRSYFSKKASQMREQQPHCLDRPEIATCSSIDGQPTISEEEEEEEYAEDPMFYTVEDELVELIAQAGIIRQTTEGESSRRTTTTEEPCRMAEILPSTSTSQQSSTSTTHRHRHQERADDELI